MNGEFLRGEVYWFRMGDSVGSEECARRPGVIVSSDAGNSKSNVLNIAYMTSQTRYGSVNVEVSCGERRSWVMCSQLATVDKSRVLGYMNTVDEDEMVAVDRAIMIALGLHDVADDEDEDEPNDGEVETLKEEIASLQHERNVWQKLYTKALEDLAYIKYRMDSEKLIEKLSEKPVEKKVEKPVEKMAEKTVEEEPPEALVDINTCSKADLRKLGCDEVLTKNIMAHRPYKKVEDLRVVPGMKSVGYALLKARVCVSEEEAPAGKVNINTASARELMEGAGLSKFYAYTITTNRNKNGPYSSLEALLPVYKIPKDFLERFGDKLTV